MAVLDGLDWCTSDWWSGGCRFYPARSATFFHGDWSRNIFYVILLASPLIQGGQLSDSGERMCTILVNRLEYLILHSKSLGPVVQSVVSLTSSLRVISLTVLADWIYNILIFFAEKMCKSYSHFFSKKFQHICVSLNVNSNESLTKDVVSFEQLGPG